MSRRHMDGAHMHVELESKGTALSSSVRSSTAPAVVLHVDDNLASLAMAESVLENAGFSVVHASNGRDAVARFDDASPDVIIMDAVMPEMDGFEARQIGSLGMVCAKRRHQFFRWFYTHHANRLRLQQDELAQFYGACR